MAIATQSYPIDRDYRITATDNGNFLILGNSSGTDAVGGWHIQLNPDNASDVSIAVVARTMGKNPSDQSVPFEPIPYRRVSLNNVASDYTLVSALLNGPCLIQVPANGLSVALLVSMTVGNCMLYSMPVVGSTAV